MSDTTARLELPLIAPSQAQKHVTHNEALRILDGITQLVLTDIGSNTPPASPQTSQVHAIGPAPTGLWAGQAGRLAQWDGNAWAFIAPQEGWRGWDVTGARDVIFAGGAWAVPIADLQNVSGVGINAAFDATNALSVSADATLLSHAGAGHQLKINKAGAGDTASLLYQSGFSGRAEAGLAGNDAFAIKVSADGAAWTQALSVDPATGHFSGAAVQADAADTTPGRIVTTQGARAASLSGYGTYYNGSANMDINQVEAGFCGLVSDVNPGTWPLPPSGKFVVIKTQRLFSGQAVKQTAEYGYLGTGVPGNLRRFERIRNNAGTDWSVWTRSYNNATVLGAVAQSAGVPTGALMERGSNANGEYVKFADGTLQCSRTVDIDGLAISTANGSSFVSAVTSYDFPAAFVSGSAGYVGGSLLASQDASVRSFGSSVRIRHGSTVFVNDWSNVAVRATSSVIGSPGSLTRIVLYAYGRWF